MLQESFSNFFNKKHISSLLVEGGQSAINQTQKLRELSGNSNLFYAPAQPNKAVLSEIDKIRQILLTHNLIEEDEPQYILGSSRLFAVASGKKHINEIVDEIEDIETVKHALNNKKVFGDIDLDVKYKEGVTAEMIARTLMDDNPKKYAAEQATNEVFTAVVLTDSEQIIQIDIVNMTKKGDFFAHKQFSSAADTAHGINGAQRDLLESAIIATHPVDKNVEDLIRKEVENSLIYKNFKEKNGNKFKLDFQIKPSLTGDGFTYRVIFLKDGKPSSYSKGGITYDRISKIVDMSKNGIPQVIPYNAMNIITKLLGFKDTRSIKHFVKMIEFVSSLEDSTRKQHIFDKYIDGLKQKVPNQVKPDSAATGIKFFLAHVPGINQIKIKELESKNVKI